MSVFERLNWDTSKLKIFAVMHFTIFEPRMSLDISTFFIYCKTEKNGGTRLHRKDRKGGRGGGAGTNGAEGDGGE